MTQESGGYTNKYMITKYCVYCSKSFVVYNSTKGKKYCSRECYYKAMVGRELSSSHRKNIGKGGKGRVVSEQTKQKIRKGNKGKKRSNEFRSKMSEIQKGRKLTKEHRMKISKGNKGKNEGLNNGMYGKIFSLEQRKEISNRLKGRKHMSETKKQISQALLGKRRTDDMKRQRGILMKKLWSQDIFRKRLTGENASNWKGGLSFEPYPAEFNSYLKRIIKKRDNYKCQECNKLYKENPFLLDIHHIDYNKKNNSENNLITLCKSCHAKTNHNRKQWQKHFKEKLNYIMEDARIWYVYK